MVEPRVEPQYSPERVFWKLARKLEMYRHYGGRDNLVIAAGVYLCDTGRIGEHCEALLVRYRTSYYTLSLSATDPPLMHVLGFGNDPEEPTSAHLVGRIDGTRDFQSMMKQISQCLGVVHEHQESDMRSMFEHAEIIRAS